MTSAIRFIGDMQRLEVKPDDVFVVTHDKMLSYEDCENIKEEVRRVLGSDVKVLVMTGGLKLGVVGAEDAETLNSAAPGA